MDFMYCVHAGDFDLVSETTIGKKRSSTCTLVMRCCNPIEECDGTEVWEEEGVEEDFAQETDLFDVNCDSGDSSLSLVLWLVFFLNFLQRKHFMPNTALSLLLSFLSLFFNVLSRISPQVSGISKHFPSTVYQMHKLLGEPKESFTRYVTCEKCYAVYKYSDCIETSGVTVTPKVCSHRNSTRAKTCNSALLQRVELPSTNRTIFYPIKVYCYIPLYNYMQSLLNKPGFEQLCDHWKTVYRKDGQIYQDVYDGKIWQDFQSYNGNSFLSDPFTYGLMLNIDWFKPCKHTEYSIGAIYLTVMNLPRNLRFKQENVLLVGLLPGPREPKHNVNAFIDPLVGGIFI